MSPADNIDDIGTPSRQDVSSSSITVNAKSAVADPQITDNQVEMKSILNEEPVNEDIMQLARIGDVQGVRRLHESGTYHPTYCDDEGISPLHVRSTTITRMESD